MRFLAATLAFCARPAYVLLEKRSGALLRGGHGVHMPPCIYGESPVRMRLVEECRLLIDLEPRPEMIITHVFPL